VVVDNLVNGKLLVYLEGIADVVVEDAGQVILVNCNRIKVENLNLSNTYIGVQLWQTNNATISGNDITNNKHGIISGACNSISGNNITNNDWGIGLDSSYYSSIVGNSIANNGYGGIYLDSSNYNNITENDVTNNSQYGIRLYYSSNNSIYHNNFVNNTRQIYDYSWDSPYVNPSINNWDDDYPSGGNYWSNYTGVDLKSGFYQNETGSDGIGDTYHDIDENNIDNYPLMGPVNFFDSGTWNGTTYFVHVISNSTISDFYFNPISGAFVLFQVTCEPETSGFCRVAVPIDLLWVEDGWSVFYGSTRLNHTIIEDSAHTYLYFTYKNTFQGPLNSITVNGTHVIPEFPSFLILPARARKLWALSTRCGMSACIFLWSNYANSEKLSSS